MPARSGCGTRRGPQALVEKCTGKPGEVSEESKPSTQGAPLLYDLTSLQREANGRFGFSARTTLSLAQALYEKHKVLTYPRTDSRALPEDYIGTVTATMEALKETNAYGGFARQVLKQKWVRPNKRIFDNAKVSDHFAIIPTLVEPKHLNELEAKLYDFVVKRFLAAFYPPAEYLVTTRITRVAGEPFKSEGKVLVNPGWLAVYGREAQTEQGTLAPVREGETVATEKIEAVANTTRPPARLNEATLLSAMEGAGKLIEDEDLREAMREKGLGTPATRAQIIEGLLQEKYIYREGKELVPTAKAFSLIALLRGLGVPELFSPELTAEWEFKLAQMEHGKLQRDEFMREIVDMTQHIVGQAKNHESDTIPGDFATLSVPCPKCGGEVHENYKKFQCQQCEFGFWKIMGGRQLEAAEAETLLRERRVGPLEGFRSRLGRPFTASIKLSDEFEVGFDFGDKADDDGEAPDFSGQEPLGPCPKCGSNVYETPQAYVCEKAVGPDKTCDFRSGRVILQRPIERAQMQKLLSEGRTDLLQFVSARTRRGFSAFLVRQPDGKIGFEFETKDAKGKGARAPRPGTALRVLGMHPRDKRPVELHSGRYGPYVKHGTVNATVADRDSVDALTLDEALTLLAAKSGRDEGAAKPACSGRRSRTHERSRGCGGQDGDRAAQRHGRRNRHPRRDQTRRGERRQREGQRREAPGRQGARQAQGRHQSRHGTPQVAAYRRCAAASLARERSARSLWRAHHHEIRSVAFREPPARHHGIAQRGVRHVAMVGIRTVAEHAIDRQGACRAGAVDRQDDVHELRRLEHEGRIAQARLVALERAAPEEMGVAVRGRDVVAAHRRAAGLRSGVDVERRAGALPATNGARVERGDLARHPRDEIVIERRVVILDDLDRRARRRERLCGCHRGMRIHDAGAAYRGVAGRAARERPHGRQEDRAHVTRR